MKRHLTTFRVRTAAHVEAFANWLLGPRCHACGTRVYPRDAIDHYRICCRSIR